MRNVNSNTKSFIIIHLACILVEILFSNKDIFMFSFQSMSRIYFVICCYRV